MSKPIQEYPWINDRLKRVIFIALEGLNQFIAIGNDVQAGNIAIDLVRITRKPKIRLHMLPEGCELGQYDSLTNIEKVNPAIRGKIAYLYTQIGKAI